MSASTTSPSAVFLEIHIHRGPKWSTPPPETHESGYPGGSITRVCQVTNELEECRLANVAWSQDARISLDFTENFAWTSRSFAYVLVRSKSTITVASEPPSSQSRLKRTDRKVRCGHYQQWKVFPSCATTLPCVDAEQTANGEPSFCGNAPKKKGSESIRAERSECTHEHQQQTVSHCRCGWEGSKTACIPVPHLSSCCHSRRLTAE